MADFVSGVGQHSTHCPLLHLFERRGLVGNIPTRLAAYGKSKSEAFGRFRTTLRQRDFRNGNWRCHLLLYAMCSYILNKTTHAVKHRLYKFRDWLAGKEGLDCDDVRAGGVIRDARQGPVVVLKVVTTIDKPL